MPQASHIEASLRIRPPTEPSDSSEFVFRMLERFNFRFWRKVVRAVVWGNSVRRRKIFLEIYNEKVKDLLGSEETTAASGSFSLRVREHPKLGPYVQGLSEHLVTDERALLELLAAGNGRRSTAATENNTHSSRSHAVFTIHLRQSDGERCETERWSKVHLVDLAGSLPEVPPQESPANERATTAQSKARLQEGANINKSLVTLGNVISALAESLESIGVPKEQQKSWHPFVPYRDSVLTWLLKDTLGGNSNTIMIATISPAGGCLSETVNTLRYAKRTKRIVNQAIVNEDPKVRTIRELRREVARLKGLVVCLQAVAGGEGWSEEEWWRRWGVEEEGMRRSGVRGVEGNDEKESVVNGSGNETYSHESEMFSDSLESLGSVLGKGGRGCEGGRGESGSGEKVGRKEVGGMLHRSRPDLIKGISARFKERLASTSSTDISNLSHSTSENSVNSTGSVEVQSVESKGVEGEGEGEGEREGEGEGKGAVRRERRSEIVEAVTTRLYAGRKKSEHRGKGAGVEAGEGEGEESKLCKRARMKLFDLSRKLAQKRRPRRTVDSDTQTDVLTGTIRMKEKCVEADLGRGLDEGSGRGRVSDLQESATQTASEEKSDKSANTSPTELSQRDEEGFSDDSLEDERRESGGGVGGRHSERGRTSGGGTPTYFRCFEDGAEGVKIGESLFNDLPLSILTEAEVHSDQRGFSYPSNSSLGSRKDENLSSDSSFTSVEGTELVSSSEASSEDFVFYETPKEKEGGVGGGGTRERELYTITENSEQSDPSEVLSPVQSQGLEGVGGESSGSGLRAEGSVGGRLGGGREERGSKRRLDVGGGEGEGRDESGGGWGGRRKTSWSECQPNGEKQYLNLNISNSSRAPFSIDTNLFGKEWRKEQGGDGVFTSADSVTLVFMGPAKPKSSVLMEIIRRSSETSSVQRRSRSRGVQCDASLVRSVSVDTAMIALSRIARNQEQTRQMGRTTSLGALDPLETHAGTTGGKGNGQKESGCQCDMDTDGNGQRMKSALKCSVGTETTSCEDEESDVRRQKKRENVERPKKSVSWLGETKYDVELSWRPPEGAESPPAYTEPDRKTRPPKETSTDESSDDLSTFLKEAIHLLRKLNSGAQHVPDGTGEEAERQSAEESEKGVLKRIKKGELQKRGKGEGWQEREESGRLRGSGEGDGSWATWTWPRRRVGAGKPPTGLRGRLGRSGVAGRSESLHSSGLLDCSRSVRSVSSGNSWNCSRQESPGTSWCADEGDRRHQEGRRYCVEEGKWDREGYVDGRMSPRAVRADLEWLQEAETDLENCCRRLELAVEQDEAREKSEGRHASVESDGVGVWVESSRRRVREGVKRRRRGECAGRCTCRPSARDPCKLLLPKGCQSTFELDSFGPGSNHCHQFCLFCRKKDVELYSSALNLNSECLSGVCRLNYYGYCPCSSVRLGHVTSSPRAYMQHLLTLRRQIVSNNSSAPPDSRSPRGHRGDTHPSPCFSPS